MPPKENEANLFSQTLNWIIKKLGSKKIPYMITGGSAVGFWGHIRTTFDIDIIINIEPKKIPSLLESIEKEAYVNIDEANKAIKEKRMFNIIQNSTCFKVDIIPLDENNEYETRKFKNRVKLNYGKMPIFVITPEDLILSKLIWMGSGISEKQILDCKSIYKINRGSIKESYLKKWAKKLKLEKVLQKISGI